MKRTWTIKLAFVCVILSLMLVVACGKKDIETDPSATDAQTDVAEDTADDAAVDTTTDEDIAVVGEDDSKTVEAEAMAQALEDFTNMDIAFDYDSSAILDSEISVLEAKADWLKANPGATIKIEGHCDERGTTEYNLALGDRRAARVKSFLEDLGIDGTRMSTVSYGEENPVALGHNEAAWSKNRRAHLVIE